MMPGISEHDEFLLSRLLDNDLPSAEAQALRRRIEVEPALRQAYARMSRLESLLKQRRADLPQVDWRMFHNRVINQVERAAQAKASSPVIRLSRWLVVGAPLAAAAAIALVVTLWPVSQKPAGEPETVDVRPAVPDLAQPGSLSVAVQRPASIPPAPEGSIKVDFKRSQQLAEAIWQEDAIEDEKPWSVAGASSVSPEAVPQGRNNSILVEEPPL